MANTPSPNALLAFTPVPCKRHNGWTAERQREFIHHLSLIGLVAPAAKEVGKSRQSAYALRERAKRETKANAETEADGGAESFADAWDLALKMGQDNACDHAIERAIEGYDVPYFYRGQQRGVIRRFDNRLLLASLSRQDQLAKKLQAETHNDGG